MNTSEKVPVGYRCWGALVSATRTRDLVARTKEAIIAEMYGHQQEEPDLYIRPIWTEEEYERDYKEASENNQQRTNNYRRGLDRKDAAVTAANILNELFGKSSED